jgi:hypothetical protein
VDGQGSDKYLNGLIVGGGTNSSDVQASAALQTFLYASLGESEKNAQTVAEGAVSLTRQRFQGRRVFTQGAKQIDPKECKERPPP